MAVTREQPYCNSNFLVDLGWGDSRSVTMGFAEVIFPQFTVHDTKTSKDDSTAIQEIGNTEKAVENHIILKRGVTGNLDLYNWWDEARRGKASKLRIMKVELLGDDQSTVVLTWRFKNIRPVTLFYSPLRAIEGGIVIETIVLEFDSMEMS